MTGSRLVAADGESISLDTRRRLFRAAGDSRAWSAENRVRAVRSRRLRIWVQHAGTRAGVALPADVRGVNPCSDLLAHLRSDLVFRSDLVWIFWGADRNILKSVRLLGRTRS